MSARQLAGPHKLPTLLSLLPKSGQYSVVHPANNASRLFLITRSKLKFTSTERADPSESTEDKSAKRWSVPTELPGYKAANPLEGGQIRAHGKAWAMRFENGKFLPPKRRTKLADPLIRHGLKTSWVAVDPKSLPTETQTAIDGWKASQRRHEIIREAIFEQRAKEAAERAVKWEQEAEARREAQKEHRRKIQEVKIFY